MHVTVQDKLRHHLAGKDVVWRADVPDALAAASWDEGGARLLLAFPGALSAARVIDAFNAGRGSRVTLVHDGPVGDVARRSAARFGIDLLDAATLAEPVEVPPALPPHAPEPLLPAHVSAPETPGPTSARSVIAPAEPAPLPLVVPQLPWDLATPASEPFGFAAAVDVTPHEILAMPWTAHASEDEHLDLVETRRGPRGATVRPTTDLHPEARHWGLPWPRPVAPADGLAIADPRIWNNQGRLDSLHADYDAKASALSIAPAQDPGTWLKKIQFQGRPGL